MPQTPHCFDMAVALPQSLRAHATKTPKAERAARGPGRQAVADGHCWHHCPLQCTNWSAARRSAQALFPRRVILLLRGPASDADVERPAHAQRRGKVLLLCREQAGTLRAVRDLQELVPHVMCDSWCPIQGVHGQSSPPSGSMPSFPSRERVSPTDLLPLARSTSGYKPLGRATVTAALVFVHASPARTPLLHIDTVHRETCVAVRRSGRAVHHH